MNKGEKITHSNMPIGRTNRPTRSQWQAAGKANIYALAELIIALLCAASIS